jgi:sugar phosphate isomerase/epimerase
MRFGLCTSVKNIRKLEEAGYDYIECRMDTVASLLDPDFAKMKRVVSNSTIPCEVLNFFFPPELKVVGAVNSLEIDRYIERAIARASALGVKTLVVGSGKSRFVPQGWSKDKARSQFAEALTAVGRRAGREGITIVIEAIRSSSTNLINNLKEAAALCEDVAEPNVYIMADYNQMVGDKENMNQIVETAKLIRHFHLIDTKTSYFPLDLNNHGLQVFFDAIKTIGYQERISIEIHDFDSVTDAKKSLKILKDFVK